jgi:hypothetical protein
MTEFSQWKEREEEIMYNTYVWRDRTYQPQNSGNTANSQDKFNNYLITDVCSLSTFLEKLGRKLCLMGVNEPTIEEKIGLPHTWGTHTEAVEGSSVWGGGKVSQIDTHKLDT